MYETAEFRRNSSWERVLRDARPARDAETPPCPPNPELPDILLKPRSPPAKKEAPNALH